MTEERPAAACLEQQLRCAEAGLQLLADNVSDHALVMLDTEGRVLRWSGAAQQMKGYRDDEIVGCHMSLFYSGSDIARGVPQRDLEIATVMGRLEDEGWRLRKDGTAFRARVVCTAIRDDLGNLLGFAELTHALPDDDSAGPGHPPSSVEAVSLTQILLECHGMVESRAQRRGVRLHISRVDTPCVIKADRQRVMQVVEALLSNAIDRSLAGGSVKVDCSASAAQRMRVSVRDGGAGRDLQSSEPGSLAYVRKLVEWMGGSIGVQSTQGEGSVSWVELVVAQAPQRGADDAELFVLPQAPTPDI
jgi:PAS domain S-box-containing protein